MVQNWYDHAVMDNITYLVNTEKDDALKETTVKVSMNFNELKFT